MDVSGGGSKFCAAREASFLGESEGKPSYSKEWTLGTACLPGWCEVYGGVAHGFAFIETVGVGIGRLTRSRRATRVGSDSGAV